MIFLFGFIFVILFCCLTDNIQRNLHWKSEGITTWYHLYFVIAVTFFARDYEIVVLSLIYFTFDCAYNYYYQILSTFTLVHHTVAVLGFLYMALYADVFDMANLICYFEFSTIILDMKEMRLVSQKVYDNTFPISFVISRLILFNYFFISSQYYEDLINFVFFILFNIINLGITYQLQLVSKIFKTFFF